MANQSHKVRQIFFWGWDAAADSWSHWRTRALSCWFYSQFSHLGWSRFNYQLLSPAPYKYVPNVSSSRDSGIQGKKNSVPHGPFSAAHCLVFGTEFLSDAGGGGWRVGKYGEPSPSPPKNVLEHVQLIGLRKESTGNEWLPYQIWQVPAFSDWVYCSSSVLTPLSRAASLGRAKDFEPIRTLPGFQDLASISPLEQHGNTSNSRRLWEWYMILRKGANQTCPGSFVRWPSMSQVCFRCLFYICGWIMINLFNHHFSDVAMVISHDYLVGGLNPSEKY